jgi:hypothetical protein
MLFVTTRQLTFALLMVANCSAVSQSLKIPDTPEELHLASPPSDRFPAKWYSRVGDGTDVVPAPVLDRPYTATAGMVVPPTGETLNHQTTDFEARDHLGRTRRDAESGGLTMGEEMIKIKTILVSDPVSHCQFHWMQATTDVELPADMRVAYVTCGPQTLRYKKLDLFTILMNSTPDGTSTHGDTVTKVEHLGPITIDGLSIIRVRVSNSRIDEQGHEKKWSVETWYSPEIKEVVRQGSDELGYSGLIKIQRKDPDPKLFYPPDNYRIELQRSR